jgi:hypothetical protein
LPWCFCRKVGLHSAENFDACFEFLKKAEILAQNSLEFKAVTFNNIACFYKT